MQCSDSGFHVFVHALGMTIVLQMGIVKPCNRKTANAKPVIIYHLCVRSKQARMVRK